MVTSESFPVSLIALVGVTGSGKSSFANLASGSKDFKVGSDLYSCTSEIQCSQPFTLDGRKVVLIDTPGFNDTEMSDTEVLRMVTAFLERTYENGFKLTGIIYFHRISDERFTGIDVQNVRVFRKLCGDRTLKNVTILTNMWGNVDLEVGEARERQLSTCFFNLALDKGARLVRHSNTAESAHSIIRGILGNNPLALQIQEELVDKHIEFPQTATGEEIRRGLNKNAGKLEDKIKGLRNELQDTEKGEQETRQELEGEISRLQVTLGFVVSESVQLGVRYREQRYKTRDKTDSMMRSLLIALGFIGSLLLPGLLVSLSLLM